MKIYYTWRKNCCRLKSRNHEASRICGYTFISKVNSKFFQQTLYIYLIVSSCSCKCISLVKNTLFTACHCLLMSSKKLLGPTTYLMICKCQLMIWLCSLAVEISNVPCTGEVVGLFAKKTGNCLTFFGMHHCKMLWQCKLFWKNFKFTLLMKFLPINP